MATHSSTLAWRIPWTEEPGRLTVHVVARVGHDLATKPPSPPTVVLSFIDGLFVSQFPYSLILILIRPMMTEIWRRKWQPTIYIYSIFAWIIPWTEEPGGLQSMELQRVESDMTEVTEMHA